MNLTILANLLKVDTSTLRRWLAIYGEFFSPQANPGKGKTRTLTDHDIRLLVYMSGLRDSGHGQEYISTRLAAMRADGWHELPDIPQEWGGIDTETVPVELAASRASELAQVAALQTELSHTRQALQEARQAAEQVAAALEAARSETAAQMGKIHGLEVELERARADVRMLEARLQGYALGGDKPISIGVIIVVAALVTAVLISLAVVLGALLG